MERVNLRLAGYELKSRLGRGSYGEVYRAVQASTGQTVAVKILQIRTGPHAPPRATQLERFRREMAACSALQHPNIVRAIDAGSTDDGSLYSVFEYVPGPTLRAVLQEHRALPLRRLREFMLQTLDALVCAHASGIIHRDFKPENIVVSTTGARPNFKVLDFGISAFVKEATLAEARLTATDEAVGTPAYAAPEQLRGELPSVKSDLYAWGLVALECLTGRPALEGLSVAEIHYQQLSPHEIRLPEALEGHPLGELLRWVTAKQVERRASDASAVYAKLEAISFDDLGSEEGYFARAASSSAPAPIRPTEDVVTGPRGERRLLTAMSLRFSIAPVESRSVSQPPPAQGNSVPEPLAKSPLAATVTAAASAAQSAMSANVDALLDGVLQDQRLRCQQALQSAGGQLVAFTGNRALGIFGFPRSHEQDARRAARCALDIHQAAALQSHSLRNRSNLSLQISGGLHTGLVTLRGDEVSADEVAGLVLAEAIDLADIAAPSEILVSGASELAARRDLEFEPAGALQLSSSGKTWPVYRLVGERDPFAAFTTSAGKQVLLGRAEELHRLQQQFRDAAGGTGRCIWVEGEPGVGKSFLVDHFRTDLGREGRRWLMLRCLPETRQVALQPVLQLVRQQLGLVDLEPGAALGRLEQQLNQHGLDADATAPLLCPWLQLPLKDPRPPRFAPQRMRELAIETLAQLVTELLGNEPAVLAVEDAHWCDATTREWLAALRANIKGRPALLLATSRPGADPAVKAACAPDDAIELGGLSDADAHALITKLAGDQLIEPSLVAEMVKRADGVPLFLEELTRYVISHRIVSGGSIEIPHSLRELLGARLDQLGPAKVTAQVAAVIGRDFDLALLQRVSLKDSATLLGDVEQLASAGLVHRERRVGAPKYRFHHALIQATAYDSLIPASREQIHRRVAETLEAEFPEVVRTEPQVLAQHWAAAKEPEKALAYAKRASMDLLMRSSHLELIEQSRVALGWVKEIGDERRRIEHELDLTLPHLLALMSTRGYGEESAECVARAQDLLAIHPQHQGAFTLLFALSTFYHVRGTDRKQALATSARLVELADATPSIPALGVFARTALANVYYLGGDFHSSQELIKEVAFKYDLRVHGPMAWHFGFDALVSVLGISSIMSWISGYPEDSRATLERLCAHAERLKHPDSAALAAFTRCVLSHCEGNGESLLFASESLANVSDEHRIGVFRAYSDLFRAYARRDVPAAKDAISRLGVVGMIGGFSYQMLLLSEMQLALRELDEALQAASAGVKHAQDSGELFWLPLLLCRRATIGKGLNRPTSEVDRDLRDALVQSQRQQMEMFELQTLLIREELLGSSDEAATPVSKVARPLSARADVLAALKSARDLGVDRQPWGSVSSKV